MIRLFASNLKSQLKGEIMSNLKLAAGLVAGGLLYLGHGSSIVIIDNGIDIYDVGTPDNAV